MVSSPKLLCLAAMVEINSFAFEGVLFTKTPPATASMVLLSLKSSPS